MNLICKNYFEKRLKHRIEILEKETLFGIYEIIDRMHKHAIKDYIQVIDRYYSEDIDKIKSESEFEKIYSKEFHSMFEHIAEDFQWRLKDLKVELMKRLDIKPRIKNKLNVIQEENESENESDDESENESESESVKESKFDLYKCKNSGQWLKLPKLKNGDKYIRYGGIDLCDPINESNNQKIYGPPLVLHAKNYPNSNRNESLHQKNDNIM